MQNFKDLYSNEIVPFLKKNKKMKTNKNKQKVS